MKKVELQHMHLTVSQDS